MTKSDEYIPERELREAIISGEVLPIIERFSKEAELDTSYRTVIRVQGIDIEDQENSGYWRIRLIVRHTFKPERKVWRANAIISGSHKTGFSGFQMTGDAHLVAENWTAKSKGFTVLYNSEGIENW